MLSGSGSRMKTVSKLPKYLIRAGNFTLFEQVINNLPINKNKISIIHNKSKEDFQNISKEIKYHKFQKQKANLNLYYYQKNFYKKN